MKQDISQPKFCNWLFKRFIPLHDRESFLSAVQEVYLLYYKERGKYYAQFWLWMQLIKSFPSFLNNFTTGSLIMFRNYLKITFRNIQRHKGYSLINISGLAVGITCAVLILLWVQDELSYDRFHKNAEHLFRIETDITMSDGTFHTLETPFPAAPVFKDEIPEIADITRYRNTPAMLIRYKDKVFNQNGISAVDPAFFQIFSFPVIKGDINTALDDTYSIIITEEMAEKYFGEEEPLGKVLSVNNTYEFKVTGVIQNIPTNSSLQFRMIVPFEYLKILGWFQTWGTSYISTFVQLHKNSDINSVIEKMTQIYTERSGYSNTDYILNPLTRIRLFSQFGASQSMGAIQYVYIFALIALFVLLVACINFMNLSTARSVKRSREIGLRKVVGAFKINIIRQFLGESVFSTFLALIPALIIIALFLPTFNTLSGKEISLYVFKNWWFIGSLLGITVFTGIVSGSYPALFLSSFQAVKVLKGTLSSGKKGVLLRKFLVIIQFAVTLTLIIGTVIVYNQLNFIKNKDLGYNKNQLLYISAKDEIKQKYSTFKNALMNHPGFVVSGSVGLPTQFSNKTGGINWEGMDPEQRMLTDFNFVDFDFVETLQIEMADGRTFSKEFSTDATEAFLINEEFVKLMGVQSAIGLNFSFPFPNEPRRNGKIVGVMKNFHFRSLRETINPLVILIKPEDIQDIFIRVSSENFTSSIEFLESTWARIFPDYPLEYSFLDEAFENMYQAEEKMSNILKYFTLVAIFIACLGLFGLASFIAEQRTKEIGIRKVLGASVFGIVRMLSREFTKWVLIANLVSWPIAWFTLNKWLQNFAYKTDINIWIFILSGFLALVIALLTVSFQTLKAARANTVDSLRFE